MASILVSMLFVPVMGVLFGKPKKAAGAVSILAGMGALAVFYTLVYSFGSYNQDEESYVWHIGSIEIWREYATLAALPVSALAYFCANQFSSERLKA